MTTQAYLRNTGKKYYSITTNSTTKHYACCISAMPVRSCNLHTTVNLPLVSKEYMYFQIDGKSTQAAKCVKSKIMTKVIDYVISINTFEQKYIVHKIMLQSECLKEHMSTIGINQLLSNITLFEHIYLKKIKKLYQRAGKCGNYE